MATLNCTELDVYDSTGFDPLPEGEYVVSICDSKVGPTKTDAASEMITLQYVVLDGKLKNRKLFDRFNTKNKSKQAQDIGRAQFKNLRTAIGRLNPRDTIELHGVPFRIFVKCKSGNQGIENVIAKYMPANKGPAPAAAAVAQQATAPWSPPPAGGDGASLMDGSPVSGKAAADVSF